MNTLEMRRLDMHWEYACVPSTMKAWLETPHKCFDDVVLNGGMQKDFTALMCASQNGHVEVVRALAARADVEARNQVGGVKEDNGVVHREPWDAVPV